LHYSTQQWVDTAFTFSNHLTLAADKAAELRTKMAELIGPSGVWVGGDALVILATPDRSA
jgi:hypothetical protein